MEPEEFKEKYDHLPEELVDRTLEESESINEAEELLKPAVLVLNGKIFRSSSDPVVFFQINWNLENLEEAEILGVAVSPRVEEIDLEENPEPFRNELVKLLNSDLRLDRLTEEINELLKSKIKVTSGELVEFLEESEWEQVKEKVQKIILKQPEFENRELEIYSQHLLKIQVDQKPEEEEEEEGEDQVDFRCGTEVSPTKGVSLDNLSPGDIIFVEIMESPSNRFEQKVISLLENSRDEETGMLPGKIISISEKGEGTLKIRVKFGENVTGTLECGSNINILCPESTRRKKASRPAGTDDLDIADFLSDYGILILFILAGLLLISILIILLL